MQESKKNIKKFGEKAADAGKDKEKNAGKAAQNIKGAAGPGPDPVRAAIRNKTQNKMIWRREKGNNAG